MAVFKKIISTNAKFPLVPEKSYFMITLQQAQAYFTLPPLSKAKYLTLSTTVEGSAQAGKKFQSLFLMRKIQKNQACTLPIRINLTSYLPARINDNIRVTLSYSITRDNPFEKISESINKMELISKLSLVNSEVAVAIKVSEVTAKLLSLLLHEGGVETTFELYYEWDIAELQTASYVVLQSEQVYYEPKELYFDVNEQLKSKDYPLNQSSFAVFSVNSRTELGEESAREKGWWQLLEAGKNRIFSIVGDPYRLEEAKNEWGTILALVEQLAVNDRTYLLYEIRHKCHLAQKEFDKRVLPRLRGEDSGYQHNYPLEWAKILGVRNPAELEKEVTEYNKTLNASNLT